MTRCPECRASMNPRELDGLPAHTCSACGALWLAREFLEIWAERRGRESGRTARPLQLDDLPAATTQRACPDCEVALHAVEAQGLQIEHCTQCSGVFFDRGELEAMTRALTRRRDGQPTTEGPGDPRIRSIGQKTVQEDTTLAAFFGLGFLDILETFFDF